MAAQYITDTAKAAHAPLLSRIRKYKVLSGAYDVKIIAVTVRRCRAQAILPD